MRYFFAFLATVGLIILVIILLLSGGGSKKTNKVAPQRHLYDYANTSAVVSLTTDGVINADSLHEQIQIHVGRDEVTFEHIRGYNGEVVSSQSYANTENSYSNFLYALNFAGFTQGSKLNLNVTGRCALGNRYILRIDQDGQQLQNYWTTTCGSPKTFLGNISNVLSLFQRQVPDYSSLMQDVTL